jgi:hypothetical protein
VRYRFPATPAGAGEAPQCLSGLLLGRKPVQPSVAAASCAIPQQSAEHTRNIAYGWRVAHLERAEGITEPRSRLSGSGHTPKFVCARQQLVAESVEVERAGDG